MVVKCDEAAVSRLRIHHASGVVQFGKLGSNWLVEPQRQTQNSSFSARHRPASDGSASINERRDNHAARFRRPVEVAASVSSVSAHINQAIWPAQERHYGIEVFIASFFTVAW